MESDPIYLSVALQVVDFREEHVLPALGHRLDPPVPVEKASEVHGAFGGQAVLDVGVLHHLLDERRIELRLGEAHVHLGVLGLVRVDLVHRLLEGGDEGLVGLRVLVAELAGGPDEVEGVGAADAELVEAVEQELKTRCTRGSLSSW